MKFTGQIGTASIENIFPQLVLYVRGQTLYTDLMVQPNMSSLNFVTGWDDFLSQCLFSPWSMDNTASNQQNAVGGGGGGGAGHGWGWG